MRIRTALPAVTLLFMAVTACGAGDGDGGDGATPAGDEAACRAAVSKQAEEAAKAAEGDTAALDAGDPSACAGLDDETLRRVYTDVIDDQVNSDEFRKHVEDILGTPGAIELPEPGEVEDELARLDDEITGTESELATAKR
ncbi:hypothetical protein [Streptomyces sp. NPDC093094]|uniref:hypothetical protein n=1 Tax=Streptomyces sp. NPDC093094 TaxID=3366026 RepID=UPI003801737B